MIAVTFRAPTESDLDALAANMRALDVKECAATGHAPREALAMGVEHSLKTYVAEIDGRVVCAFGVSQADVLADDGAPWMLCAEGIERHAKAVLLHAKRFVAEMTGDFESLANVVHADNRTAIRFIKWCGFRMGEAVEVSGEPFLYFDMKRAA